jgi:hypothetical protein
MWCGKPRIRNHPAASPLLPGRIALGLHLAGRVVVVLGAVTGGGEADRGVLVGQDQREIFGIV